MNQTSSTSGPASKRSLFFYIVLAFLMVLLFWLGSKWLVSKPDAAFDEEGLRRATRLETLDKIQKEDEAKETSYAWLDREKGKVQIPVERAMELTVAELSAKGTDVKEAYPVGGMPAPAATPAPEPAPAPAAEVEAPADNTPVPETEAVQAVTTEGEQAPAAVDEQNTTPTSEEAGN
ncbi:MAG: hypothetical protein ACK5LK_00340 [Chthoniobacterales bacterium]